MRFDLLQMDAPLAKSESAPPAGSCHVTAVDAAGNIIGGQLPGQGIRLVVVTGAEAADGTDDSDTVG